MKGLRNACLGVWNEGSKKCMLRSVDESPRTVCLGVWMKIQKMYAKKCGMRGPRNVC